ncbi:secreted protein, partial [human gut metagenome]
MEEKTAMKKYLGIFTLFFLLLTGCSFSTGIDTLIAPPKLSREQEYIYNALKNYTFSHNDNNHLPEEIVQKLSESYRKRVKKLDPKEIN